MGCAAGVRYAKAGTEEAELKADLAGLNSGQLSALEISTCTPRSVAEQIRLLRLGDTSRIKVEDADGSEPCKSPDALEARALHSFTDQNGLLSPTFHSLNDSPQLPSVAPSQASSRPRSPSEPPELESPPRSPSGRSPMSDTDESCSGLSADFDTLGRRLIDTAGTGALQEYRDVDCVWEHPATGARLLVGSEKVACSRELIQAHGVSCVVRCMDLDGSKGAFEGEEGLDYLHFPIGWWRRTGGHRSQRGLARILAPLLGFVEQALDNNRTVLVHCLAGAHRAGTAGVACLMHLCQLDVASAICVVQAARPCVEPIAHLKMLLKRLAKARQAGEVEPAIKAAEATGFQKAAHHLFRSCA